MGSGARRWAETLLVLGRGPHRGGKDSPGLSPAAQPPLILHFRMFTSSSRLSPPVSCPLVFFFASLPLFLCVSFLALRSSPCGCLCVYLYISGSISFPACLCLLQSLSLCLCLGLSCLLLIFAFSLCLALFSPFSLPHTPNTHLTALFTTSPGLAGGRGCSRER